MKHQLFFIGLALTFVLSLFSSCSDIDDWDENPRLKSGSENSSFTNYSYTLTLFDNLMVARQGTWKYATGTVMGTMTDCEGITRSSSIGNYTIYGCIVTDIYYSRLDNWSPWNKIYQITYLSSSLQASNATFSTQKPAADLYRIWQDQTSGSYYDVDLAIQDLKVLAKSSGITSNAYTYCAGYSTPNGYHRCTRDHLVTRSHDESTFTISDFQSF
jgi:hypothetical protein